MTPVGAPRAYDTKAQQIGFEAERLEETHSRRPGTSGSWPTSTRARPPRPSASSITRGRRTRSARCTKARRRWTGWSRSKSVASPSRPPRRPTCGTTTASTSSTRRATSTSPLRSSARCASSTALWRCSTASQASSPRPKRCGGRPPVQRAPHLLRQQDGPPRRELLRGRRLDSRSAQLHGPLVQLPIGAEGHYKGVIDLVTMDALVWEDEELGAEVGGAGDPGRSPRRSAAVPRRIDRDGCGRRRGSARKVRG